MDTACDQFLCQLTHPSGLEEIIFTYRNVRPANIIVQEWENNHRGIGRIPDWEGDERLLPFRSQVHYIIWSSALT